MDKQIDYKAMDAGDFLAAVGMDAKLWADAFGQVNPPTDHGTMLGWFANAIMAGYDEARRRYETPTPPAGQVEKPMTNEIENRCADILLFAQKVTPQHEAGVKDVLGLYLIAMKTPNAMAAVDGFLKKEKVAALPPELRGK